MTDETTNTEQSRVAADCPNERLVMLQNALQTLRDLKQVQRKPAAASIASSNVFGIKSILSGISHNASYTRYAAHVLVSAWPISSQASRVLPYPSRHPLRPSGRDVAPEPGPPTNFGDDVPF